MLKVVEETLPMISVITGMSLLFVLTYDKQEETPIVENVNSSFASEISGRDFDYSWYANAEKEIECLATNIYFEARGESLEGQKAVAFVTLNRVESDKFPNDICEVVYQAQYEVWWASHNDGYLPIRDKCQFSWYCDGKSDRIRNSSDYQNLYQLASQVIVGKHKDNTKGALWYHADHVKPIWRLDYNKIAKIDSHIFYASY
ncbi:MAG: hypothetical protein CME51_04360 [Halieaceae bacterium]|mgnify:FL=1|jgi:spore germination cell wall hydrolase CwlJ-like protein|nr:hypothetical protein [Halieaceae bacterium]|tara:strand:- start:751 stop:1356 length:606 start_codon:yes stop_codon:yes gene_type:complete